MNGSGKQRRSIQFEPSDTLHNRLQSASFLPLNPWPRVQALKQNRHDWLGFVISLWLPTAVLGLILGWLAWGTWAPTIAQWSEGATQPGSTAGTWGDSFGALNVLVSIAGFGALCLTLMLQKNALEAQKNDLHRQRFEATFFELLKLLRECREETRYTSPFLIDDETGEPKEHKGIEAFREAEKQIQAHISDDHYRGRIGADKGQTKFDLVAIYKEKIHDKSEATISPYFRVIYNIIKKVHKDKILSFEEKLDYIRILRGQIGSSELKLLGFNGLLPLSKDLSFYIEEYRLLKYIPDGHIRSELQKTYAPAAFQGRE
ncbi:MAG: putative phage abortive infection protein [Beijerinckiaceae bacterium]|nr:putative phage abortive infection protein [Beijerinckiaceae bacterium]